MKWLTINEPPPHVRTVVFLLTDNTEREGRYLGWTLGGYFPIQLSDGNSLTKAAVTHWRELNDKR